MSTTGFGFVACARQMRLNSSMRTPPFSAPPDLVGEYVHAWFTSPAGLVTWFPQGAKYTNADAQLLVDEITVERMNAKYEGERAFLFLHDWAGVTSYEDETRSLMVRWGRSYPRAQIQTVHIRLDETSSTFARMAVSAGVMALAVAGYNIKIVEDFDASLREFGVHTLLPEGTPEG